MKIEIINTALKLDISGFSGIAADKDYAKTAFSLMDKMWPVIRSKGLKHKGLNIWLYEDHYKVFAGVELEDYSITDTGLERKTILLPKYAYYKHIGPYSQLKQAGNNLQIELRRMGLRPGLPFIEIYGHWTNDETKLETELLMTVS
ncbi:MAG: GyrI-like domain-containing protein [Bacteroidota bacterium]|nr:GyrI-like domain-containing protein [Bacteroidota bacterium]